MAEPRIMFLPGFLSASGAWAIVADRLRPHAAVIRPDLPGFGASGVRPSGYSLDALVAALRPAVERHVPTHIVGHSLGGIVALALGVAYPEIEGIGAVGLPVFESPRDGREFLAPRGLAFTLLLRHSALAHAGCVVARTGRRAWVPAARLRWKHQPEAVLRHAFAHSRAAHEAALGDVIFGGHVRRLAPFLPRKAFLIHGDRDRAAPLGAARSVAAESGWPLDVVAGGSHQLHVERPEVVTDWICRRVTNSRIEAST